MKIGFSFGRCVNDIANEVVDYDDVLLIISRTKLTRELIPSMVENYIWDGYIRADKELATKIAESLYDEGKIHQPRNFPKGLVPQVNLNDIWMDLAPTHRQMEDPNVIDAWKNYQMMVRLVADDKAKEPSHIEALRIQQRMRKDFDNNGAPTLDDNF